MNFEIFLQSFIPMFVAIDAIGIVPLYLGLTDRITDAVTKKRLVLNASLTALIISITFLLIGHAIFNFLGITLNDFRIAGGIILLIISINDLLFYSSRIRDIKPEDVGIVPIGIPLIAGPAMLTTVMIAVKEFGYTYSLVSLLLNILITYFSLLYADKIKRLLGEPGSKAFAKVASLFLAAIAVMMIRVGIISSLNLPR